MVSAPPYLVYLSQQCGSQGSICSSIVGHRQCYYAVLISKTALIDIEGNSQGTLLRVLEDGVIRFYLRSATMVAGRFRQLAWRVVSPVSVVSPITQSSQASKKKLISCRQALSLSNTAKKRAPHSSTLSRAVSKATRHWFR